jgi:hypothetical protein
MDKYTKVEKRTLAGRQWNGTWGDFLSVTRDEKFNSYYVPQGMDHQLRVPSEYLNTGQLRESAPPFVVVVDDGIELRVNQWDWVVYEHLQYTIKSPEDMRGYELVEGSDESTPTT